MPLGGVLLTRADPRWLAWLGLGLELRLTLTLTRTPTLTLTLTRTLTLTLTLTRALSRWLRIALGLCVLLF